MTAFPAIASTLSAKELATFIQHKYNLGENYTCKLFRTGINHTYFLTDHSSIYVLRVYSHNWRSYAEIEAELNLLNKLKKNEVSISFPISDKDENFIQTIEAPEGTRYAVLFSFAQGKKIRFMTEGTCQAVGSLMARMHTLTSQQKIERTEYNIETLLELPYKKVKLHFEESLAEMKYLKKISKEIESSFDRIDVSHVQTGMVHMDIWYDNMNITDSNEITLFDFDFCGNGWQIFDVAYFCKQLFHIEHDKKEYEQKVSQFLMAYERIRSLSSQEKKLIPTAGAAVWIYYLGVQTQRFDWSNIFLSENYLKMYVGKMKSWLEHHST